MKIAFNKVSCQSTTTPDGKRHQRERERLDRTIIEIREGTIIERIEVTIIEVTRKRE